MPITKTGTQIASKWKTRLQGAGTEIKAGIDAVQVSPMEKAVKAKDKMRSNWLASVDNGKWEQNTLAVSLAEWKQRFIAVGIDRITSGATAGEPKMAAYMQEAIPVMNNLIAQIDAMPKQNIQDSINRAAAWMQGMKTFSDNR